MINTLIYDMVTHDREEVINVCGDILRRGGTVVFPTETVYGLGANALDIAAVKKIYKSKGRPSDNPLIVHVASIEDVYPLVKEVPMEAKKAMEAFWPGALTIILEKSERVPMLVTGGLETVAIRYPAHPISQGLIKAAGVPVAAPSANISGRPSSTKPQHVIDDLMGRVDAIIMGDDCPVGLESTVLDMTLDVPTILRPGAVTREMLMEILGEVEVDKAIIDNENQVAPKSPGVKYTHYAPKAEMTVFVGEEKRVVDVINEKALEYSSKGLKVGILCTKETYSLYKVGLKMVVGTKADLTTIAAGLFSVLRDFDKTEVDIILSEAFSEEKEGQAIMNRLLKAAGHKVYKV